MKHLFVFRTKSRDLNQTISTFRALDENGSTLFKCDSLERGWVDNQQGISCVPQGTYPIKFEYSNKFKRNLWEIKDVPNRSECKIHVTNYWYEINGCVALGLGKADINGDGYIDMTSSTKAIQEFHSIMDNDLEARITFIDL